MAILTPRHAEQLAEAQEALIEATDPDEIESLNDEIEWLEAFKLMTQEDYDASVAQRAKLHERMQSGGY